jgi:hypothetical protein
MRLRLNDEPILNLGLHHAYGYQAQRIELQRGENTLRIHLDNASSRLSWGAFTFSCRVVSEDGRVVIPSFLPTSR